MGLRWHVQRQLRWEMHRRWMVHPQRRSIRAGRQHLHSVERMLQWTAARREIGIHPRPRITVTRVLDRLSILGLKQIPQETLILTGLVLAQNTRDAVGRELLGRGSGRRRGCCRWIRRAWRCGRLRGGSPLGRLILQRDPLQLAEYSLARRHDVWIQQTRQFLNNQTQRLALGHNGFFVAIARLAWPRVAAVAYQGQCH